jgi:hypothetical protein
VRMLGHVRDRREAAQGRGRRKTRKRKHFRKRTSRRS